MERTGWGRRLLLSADKRRELLARSSDWVGERSLVWRQHPPRAVGAGSGDCLACTHRWRWTALRLRYSNDLGVRPCRPSLCRAFRS
eukprot:6174103-Pleurochrysis_carterae.AAC.3